MLNRSAMINRLFQLTRGPPLYSRQIPACFEHLLNPDTPLATSSDRSAVLRKCTPQWPFLQHLGLRWLLEAVKIPSWLQISASHERCITIFPEMVDCLILDARLEPEDLGQIAILSSLDYSCDILPTSRGCVFNSTASFVRKSSDCIVQERGQLSIASE